MDKATLLHYVVQASYFAAAVLFILGIKRMSSPVTARSGIQWAGVGMVVATVATFFHGNILNNSGVMVNVLLMVLAIGVSTVFAWVSGKKVAMTDMRRTMRVKRTKRMDSVPCTVVLRTTASMASTFFAVPKLVWPSARASRKARFCAQ